MNQQVEYKFYPSILDKFQSFKDLSFEDYFYQDEQGGWHKNYNESTGEYRYSHSEVYEMAKQELINSINRIRIVSEAANKGTAFNELVDAMVNNRKSDTVKTNRVYKDEAGCLFISPTPIKGELIGIEAIIDEMSFIYDINLLKEASMYFKDSLNQLYTSATIETRYGLVELYGYIDELKGNKVYDIKTTKKYEFGKYEKYWQRHVYPYCLIESGDCTDIHSFEFTCYQLSGGTERNKVITGRKYPEVYNYNHEQSKALIKAQCERFIEFLEVNRELITDKKIFGGNNN